MDQLCIAIQIAEQESQDALFELHNEVALTIAQICPMYDRAKLDHGLRFLCKMKKRYYNDPEIYRRFLAILKDYREQFFILPKIYALFNTAPDVLAEVTQVLPQNTFPVESDIEELRLAIRGGEDVEERSPALRSLRHSMKAIYRDEEETRGIQIENCVGFAKVPLGIAGPLSILGEHQQQTVYAPLATVEPTLVSACSQGCEALQASGGVQAIALSEAISRVPVFLFSTVGDAVKFYQHVPNLEPFFRVSAEITSSHIQLTGLHPHIVGKTVHVKFIYTCGDASGQNMMTIATHRACFDWMKSAEAREFRILNFHLDNQLMSDKKLSWTNRHGPRGVEVLAWGKISDIVCQRIFGCTTIAFYEAYQISVEGGIRNGQIGQNGNTANIMAAMFIACGQDAASVLESGWSHLTADLDGENQLTLSLYFPSVAVGTVGGGTQYSTQKEALELIGCFGPGKKMALAETIASFALALDISTIAAFATSRLIR